MHETSTPQQPLCPPRWPGDAHHKGFKDALRALTCLKHPEAEHKDGDEPLRDLFFNYILISPDLEGVREMAWLQAKV